MVIDEDTGWCVMCSTRRKLTRRGVNPVVHLIMCVLTAGIWLPVWGLNYLMRERWHCSVCGGGEVFAGERGMAKGMAYAEKYDLLDPEPEPDTRFCSHCGAGMATGAVFCATCGTRDKHARG